MQPQIRAEICSVCKGKGVHPHTGSVCKNCRGAGGIGTDGTNEYYLEHDGKGNVRVIGAKSKGGQDPQAPTQGYPSEGTAPKRTKRSTVLKGLLIVALIIVYVGFLALYVSIINDIKVLMVVSVISAGFLILILLYDTAFMNGLSKLLTRIIIKEPDDFLASLNRRKKKEST